MSPTATRPRSPERHMTFLEHAEELRRRLIVSVIAALVAAGVCYGFYEWILNLLLAPLAAIQERLGEQQLYATSLFEGFLVRMKVALLAGGVASLPVHAYNGIRFVFPALQRKERRVIAAALWASMVLVCAGFLYGYHQVLPLSVDFLTGTGFIPERVGILLSYDRNVFFLLQILLMFALVFQMPVVLLLLLRGGVVTRRALLRASRFAIVGIFGVAALVTPPDVVSQIGLALPMVAMFFLTILIARILGLGGG